MYRSLLLNLTKWKDSRSRKPLIILGARQVGKTYLLNEFGKSKFPQMHSFNFEREPRAAAVFDRDLNPERIIAELSLLSGKKIEPITDLLFFDEIQAAPKALTSLKHFCEQAPELAVCAAGSLLGIHLAQSSFPVGYVDWLDLHPMSFHEFIIARASEPVRNAYEAVAQGEGISSTAHQMFLDLWREYLVTGGLPEVVSRYISHTPGTLEAFTDARVTQQKLINAYLADVAKHSGKVNALHIERTWTSIPQQMASAQDMSVGKFRFKDIVPGIHTFGRLAGAIDWLSKAGLILQTPICERAEIPLAAFTKSNHFKIYMFDVGILGAMLDLPPSALMSYDFGIYKGYIAENFVAQALKSARPQCPFFGWAEGKSEIEFLLQGSQTATPVEVKSSNRVRAQSLRVFNEKYKPQYSVVVSGRPFEESRNSNGVTTNVQLPLYLSDRAWSYAD